MYINSRFYCTKHFVFDKESPDDEIRYPVTLVQYFDPDNKPMFNEVVFGKFTSEQIEVPDYYKVQVSHNELSHVELTQSIRRWRKNLKSDIPTNFYC